MSVPLLFVSDVSELFLPLEAHLTKDGYRLKFVRSKEEALQCLRQQRFALILIELRSAANALEIVRELRTQSVPLALISAQVPESSLLEEAYMLGAVEWIHFPGEAFRLKARLSLYEKMAYQSEILVQQATLVARLETLEHAIEASRVGIWDWDAVTDQLFWSGHLTSLFGLGPAGPPRTYVEYIRLIHPEDRESVSQTVSQAIQANEAYEIEHRVTREDGSTRWLLGKGKPFRDSNGKLTRISGTTIEITEQKKVQFALQESERTLDQLFSGSPSFMALLSAPDYRYLKSNETNNKMIGAPNIIGKTLKEVLPEFVEQGFEKVLDEIIRTGQPFSGIEAPIHLNCPDLGRTGTRYLDFIYQPLKNSEGKTYGIAAQGYDVTERVLSRKAVENERANFRNLFRQTPEMVCILKGPDHVFEFVNDAHIKALGFDATGMPVRRAQPESIEVHDILDSVYRTGETAHLYEIPVTLTDRLRYFNLTYAARRDDLGSINGIMILGIEVTEQVLSRKALQTSLASRDEFLSIASHELKTPLTSLKLQTQMRLRSLEKKGTGSFTPEKMMSLFHSDAVQFNRLNRLIDDMLDISRFNLGRLPVTPESFDFCCLVREVLGRYQDQLDAAGCVVTLEVPSSIEGSWDRFRLEQVLTNLLTNAMKYGPGTPIRVTARINEAGHLIFSVADRGRGIAEENQHRIFDRFERAVSATEVSGLGLGLYISKEIIELHGGKISVQSQLGAGAIFTVELPLTSRILSAS